MKETLQPKREHNHHIISIQVYMLQCIAETRLNQGNNWILKKES
jgi:hypothetical protein